MRNEKFSQAVIAAIKATVKQGKQSREVGTTLSLCQYRGPDGCKCIVGHMLTDEAYRPSFEHTDVCSIELQDAVSASMGIEMPLKNGELDILVLLQQLHDGHAHELVWLQVFKDHIKSRVASKLLPTYCLEGLV